MTKLVGVLVCIGCGGSAPPATVARAPEFWAHGRSVVGTSSARGRSQHRCVPQPAWSVELVKPIVAHLASKHPNGRIRDVRVVDRLTEREEIDLVELVDTDPPVLSDKRRRYGEYDIELDHGTVDLYERSMHYRYCLTVRVAEPRIVVDLELVYESCVASLVD
jgi:hypothetical protein